jgi:hypothetical protein
MTRGAIDGPNGRPDRTTLLLVIAATTLALAASSGLLVLPVYETRTGAATAVGGPSFASGESTLRDHEGPWVLWLLAAPVAVCLATLVAQRSRLARAARIVSASLLAPFAILGGASIGLLYLPAAGVMVIAAAYAHRAQSP